MSPEKQWKTTLLGQKTEALLNLGIAATVGCDKCIDRHVNEAVGAGADRDEIKETIDLARRIGGKPAFDCCEEALQVLDAG